MTSARSGVPSRGLLWGTKMNTGGAHLTYTAFVCANGTHGYEQITLIERTSWLVHDRVYNLLPEFGGAE